MMSLEYLGAGGSEYVTLEAAIALNKAGFRVYLDSLIGKRIIDKVSLAKYLYRLSQFYGIPVEEIYGIGLGNPYHKDVVFNTSGDVLSGSADIIYLHFPPFEKIDSYYPSLKGFEKLAGSIYSYINKALYRIAFKKFRKVIANSSITAKLVEKYTGRKPIVIHPPVNTNLFPKKPLPRDLRDDYILVVSRISPEKGVQNIPLLAKKLKQLGSELRIVIAGSLGRYGRRVLGKIYEYSFKYNVEDKIEIVINPSRRKLTELYCNAMIYLHVTPREHFGISIVEAMAAGTPTVIPSDSGAWIDVAMLDSSIALSYSSIDEAVKNIMALESNEDLWNRLSQNSFKRAKCFDRSIFHKKIASIVSEAILEKHK